MQKRSVLLLMFLFLFSNSFARKRNHIQAGVSFMPALRLNENFQYDIFKLSYAPGLQLYAGGKKFFFNTGIHYLHLAEQSDFVKYDHERDFSLIHGPGDTTVYEAKTCRRYHFIGFPIMASLVLGESKTKFCLDAGAQVNYFFAEGEKVIIHYKDGSEMISKSIGLNDPRDISVYFAPTLRVGIQKSVSENVLIRVMPEISFHLSGSDEDFWVAGIQFVALHSFR